MLKHKLHHFHHHLQILLEHPRGLVLCVDQFFWRDHLDDFLGIENPLDVFVSGPVTLVLTHRALSFRHRATIDFWLSSPYTQIS